MNPTIKDVAKCANVAVSTVSRVLNSKDRVSEKTRQKVLRAVELLNYQPNLLAQSLKNKHSNTIGLIVQDISRPYFPDIIKGIECTAQEYGFNVFLCDGEWNTEKIISHFGVLHNRNVDGIIFSSPMKLNTDLIFAMKQVSKAGIPIVLLSKATDELDYCTVTINEIHSAFKAVNYLMSIGHKQIAFIGGFKNSYITEDRLEGYRLALEEKKLFDPMLIKYSNFEVDGGEKATLELLNQPLPPTAIFAVGDLLAIGALMAAKKLDISIPQQLSIIGFGGIDYTKYTTPTLSTVCIPRYELGKMAMKKLFEQIQQKNTSNVDNVILDTHLLIRDSCSPAPTIANKGV